MLPLQHDSIDSFKSYEDQQILFKFVLILFELREW